MDGAHQCAIAPVSQGCDDQARRVAQVLVTISDGRIHHAHVDGAAPVAFHVLLPVAAQLSLPLEVRLAVHFPFHKPRHHIPCMHIHHHQGAQGDALQVCEVSPHQIHNVGQFLCAISFEGSNTLAVQSLCDTLGPEDAADHQHSHARPLQHPLMARLGRVVLQATCCHVMYRLKHACFHLQQPLLHSATSLDCVHNPFQRHPLPLHAVHGGDAQVLLEFQAIDCTKALFQVGLHARGILGL
mmetsp:Transcript_17523/g.48739  ORF Transcript_17523/g.48739 Transcript_17523/m.48739 type:complete len:241 (-) Transcript_17523:2514-3236(-)